MKLLKKIVAVTLLAFALGLVITHVGDFSLTHVAEAADPPSLKNTVKSKTTTTLTNTVDSAGSSIVKLARDIGVVALIILLIWMGYSLFIKKSSEGLADMKGRMGLAVLAVAFIFFSEQILGAIFGIFGVTL